MNTNQYAMLRLQAACAEKGPLCVGLDTDPSYLPPEVLRMYDGPAEAVLAFNRALIEAAAPHAACFKVQIAYYEAMGLAGLKAYAETLKALRAAGIPSIADIKRGDIADTAKAYARAHFEGDFEADIVTLNPYMGFDTLEVRAGVGLCMKDIEWLELAGSGRRVLDEVGSGIQEIGRRYGDFSKEGCAPFGVVVGCTEESDARTLRDRYPDLFFLIPGYGAQGGATRIAATLLDRAGGTVNSSRGILTAWKKDQTLEIRASAGELSLDDIVESAARASFAAKAELLGAKRLLAADAARAGQAGGKN